MKRSLHSNVIDWLAVQVNGVSNHGIGSYNFEGRVPDVVKVENGDPIELIEVEHVLKKELPPVAKRSLYFLVEGRWDNFAVIKVGPERVEEVSNLIFIEKKIKSSIEQLQSKEENLNLKIDMLRRQFCQLKTCKTCENGSVAAKIAKAEAKYELKKELLQSFPKSPYLVIPAYFSKMLRYYLKDIQSWINQNLINGD
jgi:hypothetical protein